ncbi:MAG: hypothetical protein Q9209_004079 [Squamulea sp. 1 TL-2023]
MPDQQPKTQAASPPSTQDRCTIDRWSQSPSLTDTNLIEIDVTGNASSRSRSQLHHSELVVAAVHDQVAERNQQKEASAAAREAAPEGRRQGQYRPYLADCGSESGLLNKQRSEVDGDGSSSASASLNQPEPQECDALSSDNPCRESSSGNSSLGRLLAQIDDVHKSLDDVEDESSSLDVETLSLTGIVGSSRRRFSYEAEHHISFHGSSSPSSNPPGAYPDSDSSKDSALDVPVSRRRILDSAAKPTAVVPSKTPTRETSPWSKAHPDWRYSRKVVAGAITGTLRPKRDETKSENSDAEGTRSLDSTKGCKLGVASPVTNITVDCTSEMAQQLTEAQKTDITTRHTRVATNGSTLTPLLDGEKSGSLHVGDQAALAVFPAFNNDISTQDVDDNYSVGDNGDAAGQVPEKPLDNNGDSSRPVDVHTSSAAAHDIRATNEASHPASLNTKESTEPFPNFTQDELHQTAPMQSAEVNSRVGQQARDRRLKLHNASLSELKEMGRLIDSRVYGLTREDLQRDDPTLASRLHPNVQEGDQPDSSSKDRYESREHDIRHPRNSSNARYDNKDGAIKRASDCDSGQLPSIAERLTEALSVDPSLLAGAYHTRKRVTSDTPEPILVLPRPPSPRTSELAKGKQREVDSPSPPRSDPRRAVGKQSVAKIAKPAHRRAKYKHMLYRRETPTTNPAPNPFSGLRQQPRFNGDPNGGLVSHPSAQEDGRTATQENPPSRESVRAEGQGGHPSDGAGDERTQEWVHSTPPPIRRTRGDTLSSSEGENNILSSCLGGYICRVLPMRRSRNVNTPRNSPARPRGDQFILAQRIGSQATQVQLTPAHSSPIEVTEDQSREHQEQTDDHSHPGIGPSADGDGKTL